jgi:hypothetical protein
MSQITGSGLGAGPAGSSITKDIKISGRTIVAFARDRTAVESDGRKVIETIRDFQWLSRKSRVFESILRGSRSKSSREIEFID